eukprot:NODE_3585_length_401_cov_280.564748_g3556_i0.p1 GENE.NODE_3585_length_401_cov_280.564748_g3556_i0~~NODE_3585_length_401_cov_280.564748_g3556_i0.p1  ORF type:complete len:123 (+),score=3.42 NODE_3585_length_401_cov_280.564748_g3556_i0:31-399(+)
MGTFQGTVSLYEYSNFKSGMPSATDYAIPALCNGTLMKPMFGRCDMCNDLLGELVGKINDWGCGVVLDGIAVAMCQAIGLGPEDPLSDACSGIVMYSCSKLAEYIEKGITDPQTLCEKIDMC